jgi:hypothetical protein
MSKMNEWDARRLDQEKAIAEHVEDLDAKLATGSRADPRPVMVIIGDVVTPQGRQDVPALAEAIRADGFDVFEVTVWTSN